MISPTPSIAAVICANGAKSPDAPTDPWHGTTGNSPSRNIASSSATVAGATPDAPCARLASFSAIISRTTGPGIGAPSPAACDSTMFRCNARSSPSAIRTLASFPNPVFHPVYRRPPRQYRRHRRGTGRDPRPATLVQHERPALVNR